MKRIFLIITISLIIPFMAFAQDTIVKKNGDVLLCKIQKEDSTNVYFSYKQDNKYINTFIDRNEIRFLKYGSPGKGTSAMPENLTFGIGIGFDYGGIGGNIIFYPQRNIGLFLGLGYPYAGFGYNVGLKLRLMPKAKINNITPYFMGMYGYNAAVYVQNDEDLSKIFYGPSFGLGMDWRSSAVRKYYLSIAITLPIRDSEVNDYMDHLENEHGAVFKSKLLPVGFSIGAVFILNRSKPK